jgi:pilus assembly protein CpaB
MNKNILIVLAGGFLIAVLVAVMVQSSLSGSKKQDEVAQKRVEILVAAKNLKTGNEIKSGDFKWQQWPEETLFVGAILRDGEQSTTDAVSGKLLRSLVKGQPVHMTLVTDEDQGDFLSANVQKGMRAVGISVKSYVLADRLIRPGDFVDVMVTYKVRVNSRSNPEAQSLVNRYATETVIENVRVLAIDKEDTKAIDASEKDADKKKKSKSSKKATLTVEVSPENAEKLMLAEKMGNIGLALRSIGDNSSASDDKTTTDVNMSRVMTGLSAMRETSSGVRIYNGMDVQEAQARNPKQNSGVDFQLQSSPKFDGEEGASATVTFSPDALQELMQEDE